MALIKDSARIILDNLTTYAQMYCEWGLEGTALPSLKAEKQDSPSSPAFPEAESASVSLSTLRSDIGDCTRCKLHKHRTHIVFGVGNPEPDLMFIGEGPGKDEDQQGQPFVGKAGQLLTRIIEAMGLKRHNVYIANIIKCRPPKNRNPEPDEIQSCIPFIQRQVSILRPKIICTLGTFASQTILCSDQKISRLRGQFHEVVVPPAFSVKVMPTFHPAYLLRNPLDKKYVWEDMKLIMRELNRT